MKTSFITIGIIVRNEEEHIKETIQSILDLNYPEDKYEVLIVDGNSIDKTQEIIKRLMKSNKQIRLLVEPWKEGTHGMARNFLADNAKGKYLAFTDGDCIVKENWLKTLVNSLEKEIEDNSNVVAVGGIRKPVKTSNWKENLINNMMATFFGSGGSKGFMKTDKKYIDSIPNYNAIYLTKIIRKERYSELGVGEDYEFNLRLNKQGYKIVFNKDAIIYHHQENSFYGFFKQVYNYGKAQIKIYQRIGKIRFFAILSPLFVLGLIAGLILSFFSSSIFKIYLGFLSFYLIIDLIYTFKVFFKIKKVYSLISIFIYPLEHISYGIGTLSQLLKLDKYDDKK